jgi:hypothetical protein
MHRWLLVELAGPLCVHGILLSQLFDLTWTLPFCQKNSILRSLCCLRLDDLLYGLLHVYFSVIGQ